MKKLSLLVTLALTSLLPVSQSSAQLIAYEGLDYEVGAGGLYGADGGTGWSAAWTGWTSNSAFNAINSGSMSYSGSNNVPLITTGNSAKIISGATTAPSYSRVLSSPISTADGSTVWISFLAAGTGGATMGMTLLDGSTQLMILGNSQSNNLWGIRQLSGGGAFNSTGVAMTDSVGTLGDTFLVVTKITFQSGADKVEMFINPQALGGSEPTSETSLGYSSQELVNIAGLTQISVSVGTPNQEFDFDEIRIGSSYASVTPIPEARSMSLLGLSLLGLGVLAVKRNRRGMR
jgi:hypothetical protein